MGAANLSEDGSPSTSEFFSEVSGIKVLPINVDKCSEAESFQAVRVYMESKGAYFNYLRSEEEIVREQQEDKAKLEQEAALRQEMADQEDARRKVIAQNEANLLEAEA